MSRWNGLSRKRRASYLAAAIFVLATAAWASAQLGSLGDEDAAISPAVARASLRAPLPPPEEVTVQKTDKFGDFGNVLVTARLSKDQLDRKQEDGTQDFVVLGSPDAPVILRDDGQGGDEKAGDGVFSGPAFVSDDELATRDSTDRTAFNSRTDKSVPVFRGRAAVGVEQPVPFDFESFRAGKAVPLSPAVAFVRPEGRDAETIAGTKGLIKISSIAPVVPGTNPFQEHVLMIRDVGVVTDPNRTVNPCLAPGSPGAGNPNGVWTFKHLVTEMANQAASGINPSDFVESWLKNWNPAIPHNINNDPTIPNRPQMNTLVNTLWPRVGGKLDLDRAPLRLLAIVPRVDLRLTTGGGGPYSNTNGNFLDAGEARFVFGFIAQPGWGGFVDPVQIPGQPAGCRALRFTVIFEYRVARCKCEDVRAWAKQWVALDDPANLPGSAVYNARLEAITEQFVAANANPRNPNGSSLGQLRTNEVALSQAPFFPWELREFQLTQFPFSFLQETTVADTPEDRFNNIPNPTGDPTLLSWILNVKPALSGPDFEDPVPLVPLFFPAGNNFEGGNSLVGIDAPGNIQYFWTAAGLNVNVTQNPGSATILQENWARHRVSRAACNGCHRRETFTHFVQVDPSNSIPIPPAPPGSTVALPAEISEFLSGINGLGDPADAAANGLAINVPGNGNPKRNFDDLARRELDIQKVANLTCFKFHPINIAHVKAALLTTGVLPIDLFNGMSAIPLENRVSVAVDDMTANHIKEVH